MNYSLDGSWELLPVQMFRNGTYSQNPDHWVSQQLPAHWQQHPFFARYAGKMVYRKRFSLDQHGAERFATPGSALLATNTRFWLRLDGVFYYSQAFLNGMALEPHESYFAPQEHDITEWIQPENELIVEVECPNEHDKVGKRLITGVFSHWDCLDPATNPGGIWRSVSVVATGPTHIKHVLLDTTHINDTQADIRFRVSVDAARSEAIELRWTITPKNFAGQVQTVVQPRQLETGVHNLSGMLPVRDPQLWWTHDLGHPHCYTIALEIMQQGSVSDRATTTFGVRHFAFKNWIASLNGVRLFIKGTNYAPGDTRIATMTRERCEADIALARECHMNMLRVHAHVDVPELYEAADEAGMLLWQDFPLQWLYHHDVLPEAERQARLMARQLYNHPSVAVWCMHNEPIYVVDTKDESVISRLRTYGSVFGRSWNRDVMDTRLKQVVQSEDQTRPVVRSSGEYAVPGWRKGTDAHFYYGWYAFYGKLRSWDVLRRRFPANTRFVTEFGAQSFPNLESCLRFMDADVGRIDWNRLAERHQFQPDMLAHWLDWRQAQTLAELIEWTQKYQSDLNRYYIDRLRSSKYQPTGGIVPFMFHDPNPAVQWSVIDYWRVPKQSYHALRLAFSPQYLFTLVETEPYSLNQPIELPIYLVNDAQHSVALRLQAQLWDATTTMVATIEREVILEADCRPIEIEHLRLTPETSGTYKLELSWESSGERQRNVYELRVV